MGDGGSARERAVVVELLASTRYHHLLWLFPVPVPESGIRKFRWYLNSGKVAVQFVHIVQISTLCTRVRDPLIAPRRRALARPPKESREGQNVTVSTGAESKPHATNPPLGKGDIERCLYLRKE